MATARQLEVIEALEASLRALEHEGIPYLERTMTMICDRAGENFYAVRPMIEAAKRKGDTVLLSRFRAVFSKAVKMPACLEDVNEPLRASETSEALPPTAREREAQIANSGPDRIKLKRKAHDVVMDTLEDLTKAERERVISSVSEYYGVGT